MGDRTETLFVAATAGDLPILRRMLYEAACWRPDNRRPPFDEVLSKPEIAIWVMDFPMKPGDAGIVARSSDMTPIGAAWYRFWTDENHSYGYVASDIPELAVGVDAEYRGKGIGRMLMTALLLEAGRNGIECISLSVERDNFAADLYRDLGFREIGSVGNAWTMIADVPRFPAI